MEKRTVFVLVPVEVELYSLPNGEEKVGCVVNPEDWRIDRSIQHGLEFETSEEIEKFIADLTEKG